MYYSPDMHLSCFFIPPGLLLSSNCHLNSVVPNTIVISRWTRIKLTLWINHWEISSCETAQCESFMNAYICQVPSLRFFESLNLLRGHMIYRQILEPLQYQLFSCQSKVFLLFLLTLIFSPFYLCSVLSKLLQVYRTNRNVQVAW